MDLGGDMDTMRLDVTLYFQRNPFARENPESLALRIGRPAATLAPILERLVEQTVLVRLDRQAAPLYRYRRPYLSLDAEAARRWRDDK